MAGIRCGVDFFLIFPLVAVVLVGTMLLVAYTRKGTVANVPMTKRRIILRSAAPPAVVYGWLAQHCPPGYKLDDADPTRGVVIFSSKPNLVTYGFFYPAAVYAEGPGTRVDLGIKSKAFQYGPLVTRAHRKLAHALAALTQSRVEGD